MIKQFISENLNGMSFTFAVLVLLNTLVAEIYQMGIELETIWMLAILVLVGYTVSYAVSYIDFSSATLYHTVNVSAQYGMFIIITTFLGFVPFTFDALFTNGIIYGGLYLVNVRKNQKEMRKLAAAINQEIAKK